MQLHLRMPRQQAQQFHAGVSGTSHDTDLDHFHTLDIPFNGIIRISGIRVKDKTA